MIKTVYLLSQNILLASIRLYQKTISPDHGWLQGFYAAGFCRYYPSCSEYTYQSVVSLGILRGTAKGLWRIMRCNPFSAGGFDPIHK